MSRSADLERRYRRLLAFYPRSFRKQNSEEILAVLLDCAQDGQTRPGPGATADLLKAALWMRLRPPSQPPRAMIAAVRLMLLNAVLELGMLAYLLIWFSSIKATVRHEYPTATAAVWHAVSVQVTADRISLPVVAVLWLWLAWVNGRGHDLGRFIYFPFYALLTLLMIQSLASNAFAIVPGAAAIEVVLLATGLAALVLIFTPQATRYYGREDHRPQPAAH